MPETLTKSITRTKLTIAFGVLGLAVLFAISGSHFTKTIYRDQQTASRISQPHLLEKAVSDANIKIFQLYDLFLKARPKNRDRARLALLAEIKKRRTIMLELMKADPIAANAVALSTEQRAKLPSEMQSSIEKRTELTGQLEILHQDDFKTGTFRNAYFLSSAKDRFSLYMPKVSSESGKLLSANKITVQGIVLGNELAARAWYIVDFKKLKALIPLKKVAVIIARFEDTPSIATYIEELFGAEWVDYLNSTGGGDPFKSIDRGIFGIDVPEEYWSVYKYFKDNSYDQFILTGTKFEIVLPHPKNYYYPGDYITDLISAAYQDIVDAADPFLDWATYDGIIVFLPLDETNFCNTRGSGSVGSLYYSSDEGEFAAWTVMMPSLLCLYFDSTGSWKSQVREVLVPALAHEIGHGLEAGHSAGWQCSGLGGSTPDLNNPTESCNIIEYGDPWDVMGAANTIHKPFSTFRKEQFGWLNPEQIMTITTPGLYSIEANTVQSQTGIKELKIPVSGGFYLIEYRKEEEVITAPTWSGYPGIDGVLLRFIPDTYIEGTWIDSLLSTYASNPLIINPGTTFSDPYRSITVTVDEKEGDFAIVNIMLP